MQRDSRDELELRRRQREAEQELRMLEQRLRELGEEQHRVARAIEDEYRREHYGRYSDRWPRETG